MMGALRATLRFHIVFIVTLLIALPAMPSAAGEQPIVASDLLRLRTVMSIDVARDGSKAVFAVRSIETIPPPEVQGPPAPGAYRRPEAQPKYEYRSHLFLIDLLDASARPRQLTFGPRLDGAPQFSPNGRWIAFTRAASTATPSRDAMEALHNAPQLWLLPIDGGEARQITSGSLGVSGGPEWSPLGDRVLFGADVPMHELEGAPTWAHGAPKRSWENLLPRGDQPGSPDGSLAQVRAWLAHNASEGNPLVVTRLDFQDELSLRGAMTFAHLFMIDPFTADAQPQRMTNGFFDHEEARFMPDGGRVIYSSKRRGAVHPDRVLERVIRIVKIDGGEDRVVLDLPGWDLRTPRPSRDGQLVGFRGQRMDEPAFRPAQLGMAPIPAVSTSADKNVNGNANANASADAGAQNGAGAAPAAEKDVVWMTSAETLDVDVFDFDWRVEKIALVFRTARRGGLPLMQMTPALLQPETIVGRDETNPVGVQVWSLGGGAIVYAQATPEHPSVLRVQDARGDRQLMDLNEWTADKRLAVPRSASVSRPDGAEIQYWIMEPAQMQPNGKHPVVLAMHGGPAVMWGPGEFSMWHEFQLLCSWGFGVVYANPRGSGGYGYGFQRGNFQNWGQGPADDVLAALDHALQREQWMDADQLVVTGGSYAGYLTAWIVGHDHRFKAAVAQRGVYDLTTFFGEGNAWRLVEETMGGWPWEPAVRSVLQRESPFTYVSRIRTPLLIMHASSDLRAGVAQSEMLYRALQVQGKPVEYVRYPGAGHDLSRSGDPYQRLDRLNRIVEFFLRYVRMPGTEENRGGAEAQRQDMQSAAHEATPLSAGLDDHRRIAHGH